MADDRPLEGEILERSSTFTLMLNKEWTHAYWALAPPYLLLFSNKEMYQRNPTQGRKTIKLTPQMHVRDVEIKAYKGYGDLYKFVLEEDIDHGKSVVARFASISEDAAQWLQLNVSSVITDLRRAAGIETETAEGEEVAEQPAARARPKAWGGLDH